MKVGTFIIKIWRWLSVLLVVGALVWTYSVFPDLVAVDFAKTGVAIKYVNKEHVFYIVMGLFLLNNVVISSLVKQIPNVDADHLPIFNRKTWGQHRDELNEHLVNWILCLIAVINTIIGFSLFALATINSNQYKMDVFDFSWFYYLSIALMVMVFVLPLRMLSTPSPKDRL